LTGYSDTVSPDDAKRIGIRKYLSKPIPQAKLSAVIKDLLENQAQA
jgi:YesN/AraC family two-component response regulator